MGLIPKDQLRQLIKEHNLQTMEDVQKALKDIFAETLQEMLEAELDTELGYAKHDSKQKQTKNSRNGYSKKRLRLSMGSWISRFPVIVLENLNLRLSRNTRDM